MFWLAFIFFSLVQSKISLISIQNVTSPLDYPFLKDTEDFSLSHGTLNVLLHNSVIKNIDVPFVLEVDDITEYYVKRLQLQKFSKRDDTGTFMDGSMQGYWKLEEIYEKLSTYGEKFRNMNLTWNQEVVGKTNQQREIYSYHLSLNNVTKPVVLMISLEHAREVAGIATLFYFLQSLVESNSMENTSVLEKVDLMFLPVTNPDGYFANQYHFPDGGGMVRKNARETCSVQDILLQGVDINRNYGYHNDVDQSDNGCSLNYQGTGDFSEQESTAVKTLVNKHNVQGFISIHGRGSAANSLVIHPFGNSWKKMSSEQSSIYEAVIQRMKKNSDFYFETGDSLKAIHYYAPGNSFDWVYENSNESVLSFAIEVSGGEKEGFWPLAQTMELKAKLHAPILWEVVKAVAVEKVVVPKSNNVVAVILACLAIISILIVVLIYFYMKKRKGLYSQLV